MKKWLILSCLCLALTAVSAQQDASIKEFTKQIKTYPFSDPNPIPSYTNIYPYFRYDGFTDKAVQREWKVIELENEWIKLTVLPEIGGKIWSAVEKSTGKPFIYENHVVKFRDVAMRGPWTSGGIEANYGIIGHTPNSVTPVDYLIRKNADGSVSCVIGVLDLLTSTNWTMEINLAKDKAYFTTRSFWYNSTQVEEPYYHWMNTGIKTTGDLQYIFPGTNYLGHRGEYSDWPVNKQNGKDLSFYKNNDFGGYKSYHVFGKYTDFFGAYWHDDDFGMARYSGHDEKAGKKIWIWGLSQQGMIWEKLLTDTDGQYTEIQSGRLFNQTSPESTFTPFKHYSFAPGTADVWTEYWYPVLGTKGFVQANNYGALNVSTTAGSLKLSFSPVQNINDVLEIKQKGKVVFSKKLSLKPLQLFTDSVKINKALAYTVTLAGNKLIYQSDPDAGKLSRPIAITKNFDWDGSYGLYVQGKELMDQKMYPAAEEKLHSSLKKDSNYLPALVQLAELKFHNLQFEDGLTLTRRALSINTNDPGANYYYGLINAQINHVTDAKDGFDLASLSAGYKNAAYTALAGLYLKEKDYDHALAFSEKALDYNKYDILALQVQAIVYRYKNQLESASEALNTISGIEPLNHFVRFERWMWKSDEQNKNNFTSMVRSEQPIESFLELADSYYKFGCIEESLKVLETSTPNALVLYKIACLKDQTGRSFTNYLNKANNSTAAFVFPFRANDEEILRWAIKQTNNWKPKYFLALLYRDRNRIKESKALFKQCGIEPDFAPFYAARAAFGEEASDLSDLKKALSLDKDGWRYTKLLSEYYISHNQHIQALSIVKAFYKKHPDNYLMGVLYAKALLLNKKFSECSKLLSKLDILPFEGATFGRDLYREAQLMQAIEKMKANNYTAAMVMINDAKKWPLNLGVGKPYQENADERLEDWMLYLCYLKTGNSAEAQKSLIAIKSFIPKTDNTVANFLPANHLITAFALQKLDGKEAADVWLTKQVSLNPDEPLVVWSKVVFDDGKAEQPVESDSGIRLIKQLMQLK